MAAASSTRRGLVERLGWFKEDARARRAILAIDAVGVLYGFGYYARYDQFSLTPVALWPWVPDSPLAVFWAFLALALLETGRRYAWLDALAFVGNVQVGLWTAYVLVRHADAFGTFDGLTLNAVLLVAHVAMAAHALVFVKDLRLDWHLGGSRVRALVVGVPLAWYLVNDALDYTWPLTYPQNAGCPGIRPITVPCAADDVVLAAVTFGLTAFACLALVALAASRRGHAPPGAGPGATARRGT